MSKAFPILSLGFVLLAGAVPVSADPITVVSSSRVIMNSVSAGGISSGTTELSNQDVLSNVIGITNPNGCCTATSSSLLVSGTKVKDLSGRGATAASQTTTSVASGGHAQTSYSVVFDLSDTRKFLLDAVFATATTAPDTNNFSAWTTQLLYYPNGLSTPHVVFTYGISAGQQYAQSSHQPISTSRLLTPGVYQFSITSSTSTWAMQSGRSSADYTYAVNFYKPQIPSPTPEPATMLLIGSGLTAIAAYRRKRLN